MDISIIIVNYNVYEHLINCIKSVKENIKKDLEYEMFVVDNNSSEGSIDKILHEFSDAKLIKMKKNVGFGAANNEAFKRAAGNYFLIINPDVKVLDDCIQKLVKFMEDNSNVGVVAPALYTPNNKFDYYYSYLPSTYSILMQQFGLYNKARMMRKRMTDYFDEKISEGKPFRVEQVMGACFLTRKTIYDKIGGFDEAFFLYQEETDWEFRMSKESWKIMVLPIAKAIHDHHSSANKLGRIYVGFQGLRSILIYYTKNFGFIKRNFLRITMITALFVRAIKYALIYLFQPKNLSDSLYYTFKLFAMSLKPRKALISGRYFF